MSDSNDHGPLIVGALSDDVMIRRIIDGNGSASHHINSGCPTSAVFFKNPKPNFSEVGSKLLINTPKLLIT